MNRKKVPNSSKEDIPTSKEVDNTTASKVSKPKKTNTSEKKLIAMKEKLLKQKEEAKLQKKEQDAKLKELKTISNKDIKDTKKQIKTNVKSVYMDAINTVSGILKDAKKKSNVIIDTKVSDIKNKLIDDTKQIKEILRNKPKRKPKVANQPVTPTSSNDISYDNDSNIVEPLYTNEGDIRIPDEPSSEFFTDIDQDLDISNSTKNPSIYNATDISAPIVIDLSPYRPKVANKPQVTAQQSNNTPNISSVQKTIESTTQPKIVTSTDLIEKAIEEGDTSFLITEQEYKRYLNLKDKRPISYFQQLYAEKGNKKNNNQEKQKNPNNNTDPNNSNKNKTKPSKLQRIQQAINDNQPVSRADYSYYERSKDLHTADYYEQEKLNKNKISNGNEYDDSISTISEGETKGDSKLTRLEKIQQAINNNEPVSRADYSYYERSKDLHTVDYYEQEKSNKNKDKNNNLTNDKEYAPKKPTKVQQRNAEIDIALANDIPLEINETHWRAYLQSKKTATAVEFQAKQTEKDAEKQRIISERQNIKRIEEERRKRILQGDPNVIVTSAEAKRYINTISTNNTLGYYIEQQQKKQEEKQLRDELKKIRLEKAALRLEDLKSKDDQRIISIASNLFPGNFKKEDREFNFHKGNSDSVIESFLSGYLSTNKFGNKDVEKKLEKERYIRQHMDSAKDLKLNVSREQISARYDEEEKISAELLKENNKLKRYAETNKISIAEAYKSDEVKELIATIQELTAKLKESRDKGISGKSFIKNNNDISGGGSNNIGNTPVNTPADTMNFNVGNNQNILSNSISSAINTGINSINNPEYSDQNIQSLSNSLENFNSDGVDNFNNILTKTGNNGMSFLDILDKLESKSNSINNLASSLEKLSNNISKSKPNNTEYSDSYTPNEPSIVNNNTNITNNTRNMDINPRNNDNSINKLFNYYTR